MELGMVGEIREDELVVRKDMLKGENGIAKALMEIGI